MNSPLNTTGTSRRSIFSFSMRRRAHATVSAGGFTLLEVMVSLAILSVSLVAVLNLHSGSIRVHNHAKHLTVATLLARSKMIDLEEYLLAEGLPEMDERTEGTFEEEGYPGYTWNAEIVRPRLGMDATAIQGLLGQALGFMGGDGGEEGGILGGLENMMPGGIDGLVSGQIQGLLDTLEQSVREVRLTVGWEDITGYTDFSIVTHIVRMEGQGAPGGPEEISRQQAEQAREDQDSTPGLHGTIRVPEHFRGHSPVLRRRPEVNR